MGPLPEGQPLALVELAGRNANSLLNVMPKGRQAPLASTTTRPGPDDVCGYEASPDRRCPAAAFGDAAFGQERRAPPLDVVDAESPIKPATCSVMVSEGDVEAVADVE